MDCILAIDIGTTSTKALLVDRQGSVLATSQKGYPTYYPKRSHAEQDIFQILQAVKDATREALGQRGQEVSAIAFSCAMHSVLALDERNQPITPVIIWADSRSSEQADRFRHSSEADLIFTTSGTPIHPMSPLCKIAWWRENSPALFKQINRIVSIKEFIIHHFTNEWVIDYSLASATGLFDIRKLSWSEDLLRLAGVHLKMLSRVVSPDTCLSILDDQASALGVRSATKIIPGGSDGCLAHLGSGAMEPGLVSMTVGTSGAVRVASQTPVTDPEQRVFSYRLDATHYIVGGASNNGLVLLDWFSKMTGISYDPIAFVASAMDSDPGARGLLFLPYVLGERAPYYNANLRACFLGLAEHHRLADLQRAVMEGICFELRSIFDTLIELGLPGDTILVSGGITRSPEWLQMLSDILGRKVLVQDANDASALGAAILGFRALGLHYQPAPSDSTQAFTPATERQALYDSFYRMFTRTSCFLVREFDELAAWHRKNGAACNPKPAS